ncbi:hypothetical protein BTS2_3570 [Bacillus sp. TS-2]|nr:hypothetical protein BTS2_3570 [Bacillus sp. TS-2]
MCIAQLTTGGIAFPPQNDYGQIIQLIPFYFIIDWLRIYDYNGFDWFFWNSVKLSFYNLIMLAPLGVYLSILFQHTKISKVFLIIFLTSLTIEIAQLILGYFGFVLGRGTNVDDLILNTLGGVIGFILMQFLKRLYVNKFKNNH